MKNIFYIQIYNHVGVISQKILVEPFEIIGSNINVSIPYTNISFVAHTSKIVDDKGTVVTKQEISDFINAKEINLFDAESGKLFLKVSARQKNDLDDLELISYDGEKWLISQCQLLEEFMENEGL